MAALKQINVILITLQPGSLGVLCIMSPPLRSFMPNNIASHFFPRGILLMLLSLFMLTCSTPQRNGSERTIQRVRSSAFGQFFP